MIPYCPSFNLLKMFFDTNRSSVVNFEVKSEFIKSEETVCEGTVGKQVLSKHKLTSKLLYRVMDSSKDEDKIIPFVLFLEGNKDDSSENAGDGIISIAEENKCPEVIV